MLRIVRTTYDIGDLARWLSEQPFIALDTETTGVSLYHPDFAVRTVQIGSVDAAWIIEFDRWPGLVEDVLARYDGTTVWHNAGYDVAALARHGITVDWSRLDDTMIALRLAEPDEPAGLKEASVRHGSSKAAEPQAELHAAMKKAGWTWATVPLEFEPFQVYAGLDPVLTARLYRSDVAARGFKSPVYDLEMQVRAVCNQIEANGVRVDTDHCRRIRHQYLRESERIKAAVEDEFGFSVTSNDQLADWLLATDARHHMTKVTPGGKPSVDQEVLEKINAASTTDDWAHMAFFALRVRKLDKYVSTYLDRFLEPSVDGMMHAQIETLAARTGRMAVRTPPLQQLPAPTSDDLGSHDIRAAVIPSDPDDVLLCADYNQIELRGAAILSADDALIEAFRVADETGIDFFTASARDMYAEPDLDRSDPRRPAIKTYWYSALYGAGTDRQAHSAGVPRARMAEIRELVAARYPKFGRLMGDCEAEARRSGWISTPCGRRLHVPSDKLFVATNYRIQGWAADIMKQAVVAMGQAGLEEQMTMLVHDEVMLSVPEVDADEIAVEVQRAMENFDYAVPFTTGVPVKVKHWSEAK